jgi:hypothetical protein
MTRLIANILTLAIAATMILLAVESQSILQWFGYGFGGLLFIATVLNWTRGDKSNGAA